MKHVIDVGERGAEPSVLTDTGSGRLLGGQFLHDEPLETYLSEAERPQYVLHERNEGVRIASDDGVDEMTPGGDYRTLAAVTDVQVRFVVGQANGDRTRGVPLADVVDVGVDDGLVTDRLWIETDGARYEFACHGELEPVADRIDGSSQAAARAYRLLDDAARTLDAVEDHRTDDAFEAALDAVATAEETLQTARDRLEAVGAGALAAFDEDSADVRRRVRTSPRAIHAERARVAHAEATSCRGTSGYEHVHERYERAHDLYETAIDAYRSACRSPGDEPTDEALLGLLDAAEAERAELQRSPLADAQQVAHGAASIDGPAPAARRWETAIRRYQDVLWLDWGRNERRFDGDPEAVRESIVDAADNLVTERRAAALACREAAHAHRIDGTFDAARDALRVALAHLDRAQSVVDEVAPNRETGLQDTKAAIEDELAAVGERADGAVTVSGDRGVSRMRRGGRDRTSLVATYWARHGWAVERDADGLLATTDAPVPLRAFVRVTGPDTVASARSVDSCAELAAAADADLAVLATEPDPAPPVRERAANRDVRLLDLGELTDGIPASSEPVDSAGTGF